MICQRFIIYPSSFSQKKVTTNRSFAISPQIVWMLRKLTITLGLYCSNVLLAQAQVLGAGSRLQRNCELEANVIHDVVSRPFRSTLNRKLRAGSSNIHTTIPAIIGNENPEIEFSLPQESQQSHKTCEKNALAELSKTYTEHCVTNTNRHQLCERIHDGLVLAGKRFGQAHPDCEYSLQMPHYDRSLAKKRVKVRFCTPDGDFKVYCRIPINSKEPGKLEEFAESLKSGLNESITLIRGLPGISLLLRNCPTLVEFSVPTIARFMYKAVNNGAYFSADPLWMVLLDDMIDSFAVGYLTAVAYKPLACLCQKGGKCAMNAFNKHSNSATLL